MIINTPGEYDQDDFETWWRRCTAIDALEMEDVFLSSLVHEYEQAVARNKAQEHLQQRAIPLLQHTSILEGLQKQLAIAQEEIHRLTIAFNNSLDMLQEDERWQQEALTLLEQLVKALQRTRTFLPPRN